MWHRVPGERPARIEAGGSVELRPLQQAADRRDKREIFRRLLSLVGRGERVKGSLRRFPPLTRSPLPTQRNVATKKERGRRRKKPTRDLTTSALIEAWGVSPRTAAAPCPKAPKGRRQSNVPRKTAVAPSGLLVSWGPANLGLTPIGLHISLSPRRRRGLR